MEPLFGVGISFRQAWELLQRWEQVGEFGKSAPTRRADFGKRFVGGGKRLVYNIPIAPAVERLRWTLNNLFYLLWSDPKLFFSFSAWNLANDSGCSPHTSQRRPGFETFATLSTIPGAQATGDLH